MVAEGDRLRDLQMRVAGHHRLGVGVREIEQRPLQAPDMRHALIDRGAQEQPHVGRHLVVAGARRVQPLARFADEVGQAPLDVGVDVLERDGPGKVAGRNLRADLAKSLLDRREIGLADDPGRVQHARVGDRRLDVERGQAPVERDRRGEALRELAGRFAEPSRPQRAFGFVLGGHAAC